MLTHCVQPLPVYKATNYIEPLAVNAALNSSLVEVHFTLRHYHIWRKETQREPAAAIDSFTGTIQQVIILKSGTPRTAAGYKRKNITEGPFRPKTFTSSPETPSKSSSHTSSNAIASSSQLPLSPTVIPIIASAHETHNTSALNQGYRGVSDSDRETASTSKSTASAVTKSKKATSKAKTNQGSK